MRVLSSPFSSLQQMPSDLSSLAHFAGKGIEMVSTESARGHTGAVVPVSLVVCRGRGTEGAAGVASEPDMVVGYDGTS